MDREISKINLYQTMTLALGRMENEKTAPFLNEALIALLSDPYATKGKLPSSTYEFMTPLINALAYSKGKGYSEAVRNIRFRAGFTSFVFETQRAFEKLFELDGRSKEDYKKSLLSTAKSFYQAKRYQEALDAYNKLLSSQNESKLRAEAFVNRGLVKKELNQRQEALEDFTKAIELKPDLFNAYIGRSIILSDFEKYEGALSDIHQAIQLNPKDVSCYYQRAYIYSKQKEHAKAFQDLDFVLEQDPEFIHAYHLKASIKIKEEKWAEAEVLLNKALEQSPNFLKNYLMIANLNRFRKRFQEILIIASKGIQFFPQEPRLYFFRAFSKAELGDLEGALADIEQSITLDPNYGEAFFLKGTIKERESKFSEAESLYQKAL
ncbi:MAG: tetratricopeptide repeat protein, partial [Simkania sp.]|nr:tetratricopeptide repeat protein [Simkania sp.]